MRSIPIVIAALALCTNTAFGQTAADVETKYGKTANGYSVSEHVWMTPAYDVEGRACFMRIYPKHVSPKVNYLDDTLAVDEVLNIIDELIPVGARGARKDGFGMTDIGGGVAWTHFNYDRVTFTFISSFRLDKIPERGFGESFDLDSDVDEKSLAEARRKEAMRPDGELMRERTAKPKVLEIRWANRKCVDP
jgi:hypothetical protein